MSLITANGYGVVAADFVKPISRAWHADLTVALSDPSKMNGKVTLSIGDGALTMNGTANVEDVYLDTVRARVVAGAGGLAKTAQPKHYRQATAKIVLTDLLAAAGESMSTTANAGVLGTVFASWTVSKMPVADAIALVAKRLGASWRMLADGTFWIGSETWPDSGLTYSLEHDDKAHSQLVISSEAPLLMPGQALSGRNVSYVEDHIDDKTVKSTVWVATAASYDRMRDGTMAMVRSARPELDYFGLYRAKVVAQSGDLTTVDLIPDDPRMPPAGFSAIPLRHGLAGCKVQVPTGTYVLIGWMGGDQSQPYCGFWEGGESPTRLQIGGNTDAARKGDPSNCGWLVFTPNVPPGGAAILAYLPPDTLPTPTALLFPAPMVLLSLTGKITSGSSIVGLG